MADIFWPGGVGDMPLEGFRYTPVENGSYASMAAGAVRGSPRNVGIALELQGDWPMSRHQFIGLFLPWWQGRARDGGCDNGVTPFWLRDPVLLTPFRFQRVEGQKMNPVEDGTGWLVNLPLRRLPA